MIERALSIWLGDNGRDCYLPNSLDAKCMGRAERKEKEVMDLAEAVQVVFGCVGTQVIGAGGSEKLYETLRTREERLRAEGLGEYFQVRCESRDLNYDKFVAEDKAKTQVDEPCMSRNTRRLDVAETAEKIKTTECFRLALEGREGVVVQ